MKMKAAVIGASSEAGHTIKKAHEHGLTVVAMDGNPQAEGLREADRPMVVDISDESAVIGALEKEKPDFVLTVPIGRYLTTVGAVNDALKLPGITRKMAELCTDKFAFHRQLSRDGLRKCHCYSVNDRSAEGAPSDDILCRDAAVDGVELAYPAILKPRYGSGSRGIQMLYSKEHLKKAIPELGGEAYVLEECIQGEEYGVDGAVTGGEFHMILLRQKVNTPPPARQAVGYFSVLPTDEFWPRVHSYMTDVIHSLGLEECLIHADIIKGEGGPFVIELSARPSGHNLHNLFTPLCTGVDMAEEYIKYRMGIGGSFIPRYTRSMMIHYFDIQGKIDRVPGREEIEKTVKVPLVDWTCNIRAGEKLEPVSDGHSLMGRGYFVLEGTNISVLNSQAEGIKRMLLYQSYYNMLYKK